MLLIPSLLMVAYLVLRLVVPMPCGLWAQGGGVGGIAVRRVEIHLVRPSGRSLFRSRLPRPLLLIMEALYAALVILVFLTLARDALSLVLWASRRLGTDWKLPFAPAAWSAGLGLAALLMGAFGVWQAVKVPDARIVELIVPGLPPQLDGFSLVQLSDLHIGPIQKREWLRAVVNKANSLKPDVMVLTGDYIDGPVVELRDELAPLADLRAPCRRCSP